MLCQFNGIVSQWLTDGMIEGSIYFSSATEKKYISQDNDEQVPIEIHKHSVNTKAIMTPEEAVRNIIVGILGYP